MFKLSLNDIYVFAITLYDAVEEKTVLAASCYLAFAER